jgi:hypothetical protein
LDEHVCYDGKDLQKGCEIPCEDCSSFGPNRRSSSRRERTVSLKLWERRDGFDRRHNHARWGLYSQVFGKGAFHLRENLYALIILLILFNLFNIADFIFTLKALAAGHSEGNPVMNRLFAEGPATAGSFKVAVGLIITGFIWFLRRYRLVLEAGILILLMYMALIAYHIYGAVRFY